MPHSRYDRKIFKAVTGRLLLFLWANRHTIPLSHHKRIVGMSPYEDTVHPENSNTAKNKEKNIFLYGKYWTKLQIDFPGLIDDIVRDKVRLALYNRHRNQEGDHYPYQHACKSDKRAAGFRIGHKHN